MRLRYTYKVDGGLVPPHHQPHSVEIHHDLDTGAVKIDGRREVFNSVDDAQDYVCNRYDRVTLKFVQSISTKNLNLDIKWEQTKK